MRRPRRRFVALVDRVDPLRASGEDPVELIRRGIVHVDGRVIANPRARVPHDAAVRVRRPKPLRGSAKLRAALDHFAIPVAGRVALDVGASAGGFTSVLLTRGATRVYALDAGFGQLRGELRAEPRVVDLERHNLGDLDVTVVPEPVDVTTIDVSYVALAVAVPQLERLRFAAGAHLVALVKPVYELKRTGVPTAPSDLLEAVARARAGIERVGWEVFGVMPSPVLGARGAREFLLAATRRADPPRAGADGRNWH
jgi:23S rRNA (cytidine1920-2'-O)/16S rRNA (cytidine1409-2'-O)-methyltransferase